MIAVALPSISQDLRQDLAIVTTFVVTTYLVVNIIAQSPGGKLGDLFGHVRTVSAGMALIGMGSVLGLFARGLPLMVAARALSAVGGGFCIPGAGALLRIHVPQDRQGRLLCPVDPSLRL